MFGFNPNDILNATKKVVVLTGAGVSAESGIPTFRDPMEGYWAEFDPETLATPQAFRKDPRLVMEWYQWRRNKVLSSAPNPAHFELAEWQKRFRSYTLITQNVDGLHEKAGSRHVLEMHGNIHRLRCQNMHYHAWPEPYEYPAKCHVCSKLLRPDIVWFGENLDLKILAACRAAILGADTFVVIGTSGIVYPAAGFLDAAQKMGKATLVINPDPGSGAQAQYFIKGKAGEVLPQLSHAIDWD